MSNLFTRIKDSFLSDINELLDQKEQKNSIAMLNQHLRRCEKEADNVRRLIGRQYTLKETFIREYHETQELADKRRRQADIASRAAETELYEFALKEQADYEQKAARLKTAYEDAAKQLARLEEKYEEMKRKLKDMQLKRMELMSRENIASANYRMDQVLHPENSLGKSHSQFAAGESYLERLEHQINTNYHHATIDARIAQLEKQEQ